MPTLLASVHATPRDAENLGGLFDALTVGGMAAGERERPAPCSRLQGS